MGAITNGYPLRIAWYNEVDQTDTLVTSSSEVVALPATNVKSQQPTKVWRSLGVTQAVTLNFDFLAAKNVDLFCVRNHNLTTDATITLSGATNSGFSPTAVSLGITSVADLLTGDFAATQSYRYWKLSITDVGNGDSYLQLGHVFLGVSNDFSFPDFATVIQTVDPTVTSYSYDGSATFYNKTKYRVAQFGIDMVQQSDRRTLESIFATVGIGKGLYLFLDPENNRDSENPAAGLDGKHKLTIFGTFVGAFAINHVSMDWHSAKALVVQELR